jgi:hypothetical protein
MEKTPIRSKFVKRLVRINDQLCFAALGRHELGLTLSALADTRPNDYTTAVFPNNPHAPRLYRKLKDVPAFAAESEQIEFQMGIVASVEHALAYVEEIEEFRARLRPSPGDVIAMKGAEDQLYAKMTDWAGAAPAVGPYRTLGYLRLLRNHYAHVNDEPTQAFSSYLANHSHQLQRFWTNGVTDLGGIVFRTFPDESLTPRSAFAVMNLLRVVIEVIDREFVATLDLNDVVDSVMEDMFERVDANDRFAEPLTRKVRAAIQYGYGEKLTSASVRPRVDAYLQSRTA